MKPPKVVGFFIALVFVFTVKVSLVNGAVTCSHHKALDPSLPDGNYVIDPDGAGGEAPFTVFCNMSDKDAIGVTVISHDSEAKTLVDGCEDKGCYSRSVNYSGISMAKLAQLTNVSSHCEQFIMYDCINALLLYDLYSWLESRDGSTMNYWGGATPGSNKCACGMTNTCSGGMSTCNCDRNDNAWRSDKGLLTYKPDLPVSKLRFGDTGYYNEKGYHTLGKLMCYDDNECLSNPCSDGGNCTDLHHGYSCSCDVGYTGSRCQIDIDECLNGSHNCHVNATCNNTIGSYICHCRDGLSGNGQLCSDVDECSSVNNCHVNATCNNTIGSYTCHCRDGFNGSGQSCSDIDECLVGEHKECVNNSICFNVIGSHTCKCQDGYEGDAKVHCKDVNECLSGNHDCHVNATCNNTIGSYTCHCRDGFNGSGQSCSDIDECLVGEHKECVNNSICFNLVGSHTCKCQDGYEGDAKVHCKDVDECLSGNHDCHVNATCNNTIGSFTCHCRDGFNGSGQSCSDINECLDGEHKECVNNSICFNVIGSHTCKCQDGYEGDAKVHCKDVDECLSGNHDCHVNATCNNTIGSFTCHCRDGFNGSGQSCSDINECLDGEHKECVNNSICFNVIGSHTCKCQDGYEGDAKVHCKDVDECLSGNHDCHVNATCNNTIGSFTCHCRDGFNGSGQSCSDINECLVGEHKECINNSICFNLVGSHTCKCQDGYEGDANVHCKDVNECLSGNHDCHVNATCNNTIGSYTCHCRDGFNGSGQSCSDIDECLVGKHKECVKNSVCVNLIGSYDCKCEDGLEGDGKIECRGESSEAKPVLQGTTESIAKATFTCILVAATLAANVFLAVRIFRNFLKPRRFTNYFILNLCVADMLVALLTLPVWLTYSLYGDTAGYLLGASLEANWLNVDVLCGTVSFLSLTAVLLDCCLAVILPHLECMTSSRAKVLIGGIWIYAIVVAFQQQAFTGLKGGYSLFVLCASFILPTAFIAIMYFSLYKVAVYHSSEESKNKSARAMEIYERISRDLDVAWATTVVMAIFVCCWLPFFVISVCVDFMSVDVVIVNVAKWLTYLSAFLVPAVYLFLVMKLHRLITEKCECLKCSSNNRAD